MNGFILLDLDFGGSQIYHKVYKYCYFQSFVDNFGLKLLEGQWKIYCPKCHIEHIDDYNLSSFLFAVYSMSQIDDSGISAYESELFNIRFIKQIKNGVNFLSIIFLKQDMKEQFITEFLSLHTTSILNSLSIIPSVCYIDLFVRNSIIYST